MIVGAKLVPYSLTRDRYDPCVIRDAGLLSVVTAIALKRGLSGLLIIELRWRD